MTALQARRAALQIPKKEIGRRLDPDPYLYGRIEGGSVAPSGRTVRAIATLLGTDARELFDGLHPCGCGKCGTLVPRERKFAKGHHDKSDAARHARRDRRAAQGIPEEKLCEGCGRAYTRRRGENLKKWTKRRWCSAACWRESPICRTPPHERQWDSDSGASAPATRAGCEAMPRLA